MIELAIDVETTGFPIVSKPLDHDDQPHIVQFGAIMRKDKCEVSSMNIYVKCPIEIPHGAFKVHGISQMDTIMMGVPMDSIIFPIGKLIAHSDVVIGHNISFDMKMLHIAAARSEGVEIDHDNQFCTMKQWANTHSGKWPKLDDAFSKVTNEPDMPSHNAFYDAKKSLAIYDFLNKCLSLDCPTGRHYNRPSNQGASS